MTMIHPLPDDLAPELLLDMIERAPDAMCLVERASGASDFRFRYVNRAFEVIYDCRRVEVLGAARAPFFRARGAAADFARIDEGLAKGDPFRIRRGFDRKDGTHVFIEVNFQPLPCEGGERWMFITRDVTREKLQHDRMVQLTTAVEQGVDPVVISRPSEGKWPFVYVNEAFTRVTGYLPEEVIGRSWDMLVPDQRERVRLVDIRAALFSGQQVRTDLKFRTKDGRNGIFEVQIQPIQEPASGEFTSLVAMFHDVTAVRQREQALQFEAEHDTLTGLFNRRYLERMLGTAIAMSHGRSSHALLFADLDGFKAVNDRLGHDAGDRVLIAAGRAFANALFVTDVLARWGGDEFAVLLFHCTPENAVKTARAMSAALMGCGEREETTVSIGVVPIRPGEHVAELIRRADRACYLAKAAGRDQVYSEGA